MQAGVTFSTRNRRRIARAAAARPPQPPAPARPQAAPPRSKAAVAVPRVGVAAAAAGPPARAPPRRRRPAHLILRELRDAEDEAAAAPAPAPARPLLGDAEKERLALSMQYRGKPPAPPAPRAGAGDCCREGDDGGAAAARGARGEAGRLQARFDMLAREVAEREEWQAAMRRDGLARGGHAAVIRLEIAERAAEMERVDAVLRQLDGRA